MSEMDAAMTEEMKLLEAKTEMLQSASAFIEKFYTSPGSDPAFDWVVSIIRRNGEYVVRVQTGGDAP